MIECPRCSTLNPDRERSCLACGGELVTAGRPAAGPARCPAGHPIDPSWAACPYCERAGSTGFAPVATRLDQPRAPAFAPSDLERTTPLGQSWAPAAPGPASARPSGPPALGATRLEEPAAPRHRRTVLQESVPPPAAERREISGRSPATPPALLVAVLAAPEIGPGGAVFPIRAGKTHLGSDRRNDVVIDGDSQVSAEHAVILYRDGLFYLSDRLSTNGTWINGLEVPANGTVVLRDRDRLRLGNSQLTLLFIDGGSPPLKPGT